jgi:DNA-binding phage protein
MAPERKTKPLSADHAALAAAIEALIAEHEGMSQETVARESGLNLRKVNDLCRGQSNPTFLTLIKLTHGLHVRLAELMARVDEFYDQGTA